MSLFQKSVEKKYLNELNSALIDKKYKEFQDYFGHLEIQENIRSLKEEEFQEGFIRELFVNILGYTLKPHPQFNIVLEKKNVDDSRKADGAILKGEHALAVIELKGTNTTDLDSVETQAFGYKNHHPKCVYIITSNFEKLRFYIQNTLYHIDFDLFKLSREQFSLMWLCIEKDNLLSGLPQKIMESSVLQEENITKKLYADYSKFREAIFTNLVKNNPDKDKLLLFKKTQKLLDRFLFIFFAEDRLLLPPNSISEIVKQWTTLKELDEYVPLYERFKKYFGYLNTGRKDKKYEIYAYNGGLFFPDEILDNIIIDDDILYEHTVKLSNYDFETDVDVNILGHIFEHSLGEIENVQAQLKGEKIDQQKTKRKKDGIFYTPKYITKYIVENTVGKLCKEKRNELNIIDEEYAKGRRNRKKDTIIGLDEKLTEYRKWMLSLTILDPACGSGAFLNQALDFLIEEHRKIDELRAQLFGGSIVFSDITNDILENNIFGVDLNEESVEIAKLSLWLRTAQKGRKLNTLSNNIKCGNSLIDDPEVASDKAFNWQNEFPEIFANGGFDVVIGNPPYGAKVSKDELKYLVNRHKSMGLSNTLSDTYIAFYIKSLEELLKERGLLSFITPNTWRLILNGKEFRNFISKTNYTFQEIIQHQEKVFSDATVDCDTLIIKKQKIVKHILNIIIRNQSNILLSHSLNQIILAKQDFFNLFLTEDIYNLKQKIEDNSVFVKDELLIKNGVKPYERGKGKPAQTEETMNKKPFTSEIKLDNTFTPLIGGSSFHRYKILWNNDFWIKYGEWLAAPRDKEIFTAPEKLIFRQTADSIIGAYIENGFVMRNNTHILLPKNAKYNLKYVLSILNSKVSNLIYWTINPEKGEAMAEVKAFHLGLLCFKDIDEKSQQPFIEKADKMLRLNNELQNKSNRFLKRVNDNLNLKIITKKLEAFYENDFKTFIAELNKQKISLSLIQQDEWEEYFYNYKVEINQLQTEIERTDNEIDRMVYELFGLTTEEIKIVEESV